MLAGAVARVEERRRRRVAPAERLIVAHIGPQSSRARLALRQHRHGGVVGMDAFGCEHMRVDRLDQRRQRRRHCADPVRQCRDVEIDPFARIGGALPVERQVQGVFEEQHLREQRRSGASARDRMRGRRRLRNRLAGAAGELLAHVLDHLPLARHDFQRLGHVLAQLAQHAAAARAGRRRGIDDALARQVLRQRAARRLLPLEAAHLNSVGARYLRHDLGRRFGFGRGLFQVGKLQFELLDQRAAFGRLSEPLVAQLGDDKLQLRNLERPRMRLCFRAAHLRLRLDPRRAFGEQHRLQRRNVVGERISSAHLLRSESQTAALVSPQSRDDPQGVSAGRLRSPRLLRHPPVDPFQRRGLEVPPRLMMTCPCQGISKSSIQPIRFLAGAFASSPLHEERARIPVRAYNGNSVSRCLCPWRSRISGCVKSSGPCEPGLASKHWKIWLRRPKEARAHAHRASGRLAQSAGGAPPDDRRRYRRGLPGDEPWARSSSNRII